MSYKELKVAVIIPCYKVKPFITSVIAGIGKEADLIYVVDDACPDQSGDHVRSHCPDPRVRVIELQANQGVGGATIVGYQAAIAEGASLLVKIDGDGQMDPGLIPYFLEQILVQDADYAKGNRFFRLQDARDMPRIRLIGNLVLSFMTKLSSGYWQIVDPTNGFTVLRADVAAELNFDEVDRGYFFESDLLLHLNSVRAVVVDVPMQAVYGSETSNLKVRHAFTEFFSKNLRNTVRRLRLSYFTRDFSLGSAELLLGSCLLLFGICFGTYAWIHGIVIGVPRTSGTVMLAALPTLVGLQLLMTFFNYDVANLPRKRITRAPVQVRGLSASEDNKRSQQTEHED